MSKSEVKAYSWLLFKIAGASNVTWYPYEGAYYFNVLHNGQNHSLFTNEDIFNFIVEYGEKQ